MIDLNVTESQPRARKPDWLRVKLPIGEEYKKVRHLVDTYNLHTICQSGNCPNMGECWGAGTATFMILGNVCTRSCSFCAVKTGRPNEYDEDEPRRVAEAIALMQVKHAVITSVNRDELKDRGAEIWYQTVTKVKAARKWYPIIWKLSPDYTDSFALRQNMSAAWNRSSESRISASAPNQGSWLVSVKHRMRC